MKRLFFIAIVLLSAMLFCSATELEAQSLLPKGIMPEVSKKGLTNIKKFGVIRDGDRLAFQIDYSKASFKGYTEEEIANELGKDNWEKAKSELRELFVEIVEEELGRKSLLFFKEGSPNVKFNLILSVGKIDKRGNLTGTLFLFENGETESPISYIDVYGDGGRIGDYLNLMGDGHKSTAESVGKFLRGRVKRK